MIPGSIDLHVHCAPDVRPRKATAFELACSGKAAGMGGRESLTRAIRAAVRA